jgi:non-ribosomal peptide synthetase component F
MYTFVEPLYRAQKLFANDVAMVSGGVRLTYAETWSRCRRLAGALTRLGVEPGERVDHLETGDAPSLPRAIAMALRARGLDRDEEGQALRARLLATGPR